MSAENPLSRILALFLFLTLFSFLSLNHGTNGSHQPSSAASAPIPILSTPPFTNIIKQTASDGQAGDFFGVLVATNGNLVMVGAPRNNESAPDGGSIYLFERHQGGYGQWGQTIKLWAADSAAGDEFGIGGDVSADSNLIAVGAWQEDTQGTDAGAVYIFGRNHGGDNNWGQVIKITAADGQSGDQLGHYMSLDGDTLAVSAKWDDDRGSNAGAVYIFERNLGGPDNWGQVIKITGADISSGDEFGVDTDLEGDTLVVGARYHNANGTNSGAAYVFERNQGGADNWGQTAKILASDGSSGNRYGSGVGLSGDIVVIGSQSDSVNGTNSGSAYIYQRDQGGAGNWGEVTKIVPSDGSANDLFGDSVTIDGDVVIIGARGESQGALGAGAAYVYERNLGGPDNWGELTKVIAFDPGVDARFGWSVSYAADVLVVGAYLDDSPLTDSGSAYIYDNTATHLFLPLITNRTPIPAPCHPIFNPCQ